MKMTTKKTVAAVAGSTALLALAGFGFVGTGSGSATNGHGVEAHVVETGERAVASYGLDKVHSSVVFKIRHIGAANFYGRFNDFDGSFEFNEDSNELVSVSFEIPMESVDSNNGRRDGHLKSGDFFNVGQYPTASFESTGFTSTGEDTGTLTGNLTFMGETKEVTANVIDIATGVQGGTEKFGFEAQFSIKRSEFGVTSYLADDGGEDGALGNTVHLMVAVEAAKN